MANVKEIRNLKYGEVTETTRTKAEDLLKLMPFFDI